MQWVLFLFLPFLIEAGIALAPGMYPPEEMSSDVQNVPRNPYQIMDDNTPQAYQFYYEKDDDDKSGTSSSSPSFHSSSSPSASSSSPGSGPVPPTIQQPPPLPNSVSPPSSSHATSTSSSSSSSSPPAAHLISSSGASSEDDSSSSQLPTYETLDPEQLNSNSAKKLTTKTSSNSLVEFTTSPPRTTARISQGFPGAPNNLKPYTSSVVFASNEEEADPRSEVEQLVQEEHKLHEVSMKTEVGSDQEYGESGASYKEPKNGNPLDYRPVSGNFGDLHSGEQPPATHKTSGAKVEEEQYGESAGTASIHPSPHQANLNNINQLERNKGNQGKHTGQYSHQITLAPDSPRSWLYEGAQSNKGGRKNCCACCGDKTEGTDHNEHDGVHSNVPYDFSGSNSDIGEPKPIVTDKQGYQESVQPGNMVLRPNSPEIPTLAPERPLQVNSQQINGYQPASPNQLSTFPGQQPYPQQNVPSNYQPVGTYQPLYDSPSSGCPCAAPPPPQMCCQPVTPCCLPTIPCCPPPPPIPCCPQQAVCCQPPPAPCCPVQQTCCSQPVIPQCFRSCPSCPCRRRLHAHLRMKRSPGPGCQSQCTASGQVMPGRVKRQVSGCKSCNSSPNPLTTLFGQLNTGCGTCSHSHRRVKRMGCLPCLGRKKRDIDAEHHRRVKRLGCLPCLGKRKKRSLGNCHSCSNLGNILHRSKRTICSPCGGRKKREAEEKELRRAPCSCQSNRGATSYQSSYTLARKKREIEESFDSVFTCDKSCCDYNKCDKIRAKRLDLN